MSKNDKGQTDLARTESVMKRMLQTPPKKHESGENLKSDKFSNERRSKSKKTDSKGA